MSRKADRHDPATAAVARVILDFDWHNYGLDEVGEIDEEYADYAWELAGAIVSGDYTVRVQPQEGAGGGPTS